MLEPVGGGRRNYPVQLPGNGALVDLGRWPTRVACGNTFIPQAVREGPPSPSLLLAALLDERISRRASSTWCRASSGSGGRTCWPTCRWTRSRSSASTPGRPPRVYETGTRNGKPRSTSTGRGQEPHGTCCPTPTMSTHVADACVVIGGVSGFGRRALRARRCSVVVAAGLRRPRHSVGPLFRDAVWPKSSVGPGTIRRR